MGISKNRGLRAALLLAVLAAGCSRDNPRSGAAAGPAKPIPVDAVTVSMQAAERLLEVTGTLQPDEKVTVSSEVEGSIKRILVDLGDRVTPGQLLAQVNPEEFEIDIRQQQARLRQMLAQLGLKEGQDPRSIHSEDTPEVRAARSALEEAQQNYQRAADLFKLQIGTAQAVDQTGALLKTAQARLTLALESIEQQRAQIEQSRVALELAQKKLKDTSIYAPFAGSVSERLVSLGQFARAQTPLFVIVRTNPLRFRAEISERFAASVRTGQPAQLRVDGLPDRSFPGTISRISPSVSEQSRTLLVEALVRNEPELLRPGMFARASIQSGQMIRALMVPARAVLNFYGVTKVFCVTDGRAQDRTVRLGDRFGERFEVLEGLRDQEVIAVSNLDKLATGQMVTVQRRSQVADGGQP